MVIDTTRLILVIIYQYIQICKYYDVHLESYKVI